MRFYADLLLAYIVFFFCFCKSFQVILKRVRVPVNATEGDRMRLVCEFDLQDSGLYSVKWYKDNEEIFRFVPSSTSPIRSFPMEGVKIDISESKQYSMDNSISMIILERVTKRSSGVYKCEVSGESPYFHTQVREGQMLVQGREPTYLSSQSPSLSLSTCIFIPLTVVMFIFSQK